MHVGGEWSLYCTVRGLLTSFYYFLLLSTLASASLYLFVLKAQNGYRTEEVSQDEERSGMEAERRAGQDRMVVTCLRTIPYRDHQPAILIPIHLPIHPANLSIHLPIL